MAKRKGKTMKAIAFIAILIFLAFSLKGYIVPAKRFDAKENLAKTHNDRLIPKVHKLYGSTIAMICRNEKVSPALCSVIEKMIIIESSCNPNARKANDGVGLLGVKPSDAIARGVDPDSLMIPYWNLVAGIRHLNYLVNRLNGDVPGAVVAYNCGLKNYRKNYQAAGVNATQGRYFQKVQILAVATNQ